jgi:uncharacterized protein YeaO (DUF488 family)
MTGAVRDTYVAALQHDLVAFEGDERLVGVVREPTGWFRAAVDENVPELGPPADLLEETKQRTEDFEMQGLCSEGAHNAAWEETDFEGRYRTYLDESDAAQRALDRLRDRIEDGGTVVLVCFGGDGKRCHRSILRERLEGRAGAG